MIKTQLWSPDTCGCVVEQRFEYDTNPATLVSETIVKTCPAHANGEQGKVKEENQRKNVVWNQILADADFGSLAQDGSMTIKDGITVSWVFNDSRQLVVTIVPLTTQQRSKVQNRANQLFGAGKVIVV